MLHKTDDTPWSEGELSVLKDIRILNVTPSGSVLGAEITLSDGTMYTIDFKDIDGHKSC